MYSRSIFIKRFSSHSDLCSSMFFDNVIQENCYIFSISWHFGSPQKVGFACSTSKEVKTVRKVAAPLLEIREGVVRK